MIEKLSEMSDARLKATYLMYRDGDDTYQFYEIKEEFERRAKEQELRGIKSK